MIMTALFAVELGAPVKQVQPSVIQRKRQDETILSVNIKGHTPTLHPPLSNRQMPYSPALHVESVDKSDRTEFWD